MPKYIKEVFNDYGINNNLIEAEIENINLYKKTNKLQVKIASSKEITLQDIETFEKAEKSKILNKRLEVEVPSSIYEELKSKVGE